MTVRPLFIANSVAGQEIAGTKPRSRLRERCWQDIITHMKHLEAEAADATSEERATSPVFLLLLEAARVQQERLEDALKQIGLSRAKMEALQQLLRAGEPMPLRALAEGQRCVPSNMTTLVDRLESEGLVRRVDDPDDRRSVRAELTPFGLERAEAGTEVLAQVEQEFASSLPPAERAALRRILASLRPL